MTDGGLIGEFEAIRTSWLTGQSVLQSFRSEDDSASAVLAGTPSIEGLRSDALELYSFRSKTSLCGIDVTMDAID